VGEPLDLCPCESGVAASTCCRGDDGSYWKRPVRFEQLPSTGFQHPRCYARVLGDCSTQLSREHLVPKAILKQFGNLLIRGLPGAREGSAVGVGPNALAARVLCRAHNSALSEIDSQGTRFFQTLDSFRRRALHPSDRDLALFSGPDVERFILKCGIAFCASGLLGFKTANERLPWVPPSYWVQLLFGRADWKPGCGLSLWGGAGHRFEQRRSVLLEPMAAHGVDGVAGLRLAPHGMDFVLAVDRVLSVEGADLPPLAYRPGSIAFNKRLEIMLTWLPGGLVHAFNVNVRPL